MSFRPLNTKVTTAQNYAQVNDLARQIKNSQSIQVFKDETATRRVLLGKGKDGFYGLKVSQVGVDVYTATDDQLIFNSSQNVLKIDKKLTGSFTDAYTEGGFEGRRAYAVPHGLTYAPYVTGGIRINWGSDGEFYYPFGTAGVKISGAADLRYPTYSVGGVDKQIIYNVAWSDTTNVYIKVMTPNTPVTFNYTIFCIVESIE